jgi:ketol-acid reductoisomerase
MSVGARVQPGMVAVARRRIARDGTFRICMRDDGWPAGHSSCARGEQVVGDATRQAMKKTLADIQSGKFAQEWIAENKAGCPNFNKLREKEKQHPIEIVGAQLRAMMSWLPKEGKKQPAPESTKQVVNA